MCACRWHQVLANQAACVLAEDFDFSHRRRGAAPRNRKASKGARRIQPYPKGPSVGASACANSDPPCHCYPAVSHETGVSDLTRALRSTVGQFGVY